MTLYPLQLDEITTDSADGQPSIAASITALPNDCALVLDSQGVGTGTGVTGGPYPHWYSYSGSVPTVQSNLLSVRAGTTGGSVALVGLELDEPIPNADFTEWTIPYVAYLETGSSPDSTVTVTSSWYDTGGTPHSSDITLDVTGVEFAGLNGSFTVTQDHGTGFKYVILGRTDYSVASNSLYIELDVGDLPGWVTRARLVALTADGYTVKDAMTFDWLGYECTRAVAATSDGNVLAMTGRGVRGYRLLTIDYTAFTITAGDIVPVHTGPAISGAYNVRTIRGQGTTALTGTDDFVFLRKTDEYQYAEAVRVDGTDITVLDAISLSRPNSSGDGWGTVIPKNGGTAFAALSFPSGGGGSGPSSPKLRTYEIDLDSDTLSVTYVVDTVRAYRDYTELFPYPPEMAGDTSVEAATAVITVDSFTSLELLDLFLLYPGAGNTALATYNLPELDMTVRPEGVSATGTTLSVLEGALGCVAADGGLYVARPVYLDPTDASTGGRTMITQYDPNTNALIGTVWDQAIGAVGGSPMIDLGGIYASTVRSVLFLGIDAFTSADAPTGFNFNVGTFSAGDLRLLDYSLDPRMLYDLSVGGYNRRTAFVG